MVAANSLKNLKKGKRIGHELPIPKSPGRPRKRQWVNDLEALAASPAERIAFLRRVLHKHPVDAMHYLAGKPLEQLRIEGPLGEALDQKVIEAAVSTVQQLLNPPCQDSGGDQKGPATGV